MLSEDLKKCPTNYRRMIYVFRNVAAEGGVELTPDQAHICVLRLLGSRPSKEWDTILYSINAVVNNKEMAVRCVRDIADKMRQDED